MTIKHGKNLTRTQDNKKQAEPRNTDGESHQVERFVSYPQTLPHCQHGHALSDWSGEWFYKAKIDFGFPPAQFQLLGARILRSGNFGRRFPQFEDALRQAVERYIQR